MFTFAKHVSFEQATPGIPCPVISSRREGNINKRTKLKSFLTLDRRSVSPHRPACVRALRGQWAIWLAPRLSLATESTGTVLIPSQMSEIAGHGRSIFTKQKVAVVTRDGRAHYNLCTYFGMLIKLFLIRIWPRPPPPFLREYGFKKISKITDDPLANFFFFKN